MQQQIAVVTLGIESLPRSRRFYVEGFGWKPVFENDEIIFYQMNGLVLGTWLASALMADSNQPALTKPGAFALAHNVAEKADVDPTIAALIAAGGRLLKSPEHPPHGGYSGYVADPDDHAWEIAWNPAWVIDENGLVKFGL